MKQSSTLFLKFVLVLIGLTALIGMIWFPQTEGRAAKLDLVSIYTDPLIIYLYIASLPFFVALFQATKILNYVDRNQIFSQDALKAITNIKYCASIFAAFIAGATVYIFVIARAANDDYAGAVSMGLIITFASVVIGTAAGILQRLLQNAVDLKSENDLTV